MSRFFGFFFFKWWRRVTWLHCTYLNVNIYRSNMWNRRWDFFSFLCLLTFEDWLDQSEDLHQNNNNNNNNKKKIEHVTNQWENRRKSGLYCTYFILLLCAFYLPHMQGDSTTPPVWNAFHFVCSNRKKREREWERDPACLTWVQRVLYNNVRLCRSTFISLNCIQKVIQSPHVFMVTCLFE